MSFVGHQPVLLEEVLDLLRPRPGDLAVDCTVGRAGHALALARAVGTQGRLVGFDLDQENLRFCESRLGEEGLRLDAVKANFATASIWMSQQGLRGDVVLADLGFSSNQMDDPARGFSFRHPGALDMRYDRTRGRTAADLIASLDERELTELIRRFGEEPLAGPIARKLVQKRSVQSIDTTEKLAHLVREAYGNRARSSRLNPATRTFMALRIAVNDELASLHSLLEEVAIEAKRIQAKSEESRWFNEGARLAIISFHSLEDRLVKQTLVRLHREGLITPLTRKPVVASPVEVGNNTRARSAKLRAARIAPPDERRDQTGS